MDRTAFRLAENILQGAHLDCGKTLSTMQAPMGPFLLQNKVYICSAILATIILISIFKLAYPYPNMVMDSYYYIVAAISHADAGAWAIGYSWFLRLFGFFSRSALLLVIFQYLFLEASLLVFFLTLTRVFPLSRISKWILFVFLFGNPLLLYCANFVMADALFIALSALWLSLLIWMLIRPQLSLLWVHTVLILLVFSIRYNALYYPAVATIAFIISKYGWRQKLLGIILQVAVIGGFIWYTTVQVGAATGKAQFSPFGNWKTANDALYMYGHIYQEAQDPIPAKFAMLDHIVRQYFQSSERVDDLLDYRSQFYGSVYMFYYTSPLIRYRALLYGEDTEVVNFKKMAYMGPLYGDYGAYLIRKHPMAFTRYFVVPNAVRYLFPPMECFVSHPPFHLRPDYLGPVAANWFGLQTITVSPFLIDLRTTILSPYQTITALIHVLFVLSLAGFALTGVFRTLKPLERSAFFVLLGLWICDLGFSLTAAATVMRYEILPLLVEFSLIIWLTPLIYTSSSNTSSI